MSDRSEVGMDTPGADIHDEARRLSDGEDVLLNDRTVPLTVTGRHSRPSESRTEIGPRRVGVTAVIELVGNGTTYHLLCWDNAIYGPMLYRQSEWETVDDDPQFNYKYPGRGERVRELRVSSRGTNQDQDHDQNQKTDR